jgi:mannose-6-phosphate isomerase-like protein (cupin superfamily)
MFKTNIEKATEKNTYYRKVLYTNKKQQLVLMRLRPGEQIGDEVHKTVSQFIRVESGSGYAVINGHKRQLKAGDCLVIDPNTKHNIVSTTNLKLYTIYSPPKHSDDCVQKKRSNPEC